MRKWPNDALAPVLFFVDDLCNKWVDLHGDGRLTAENDWGHGGLDENGAYRFLEREILEVNPEVKVTFFVPVGERAPVIRNSPIKSYSYPMNYDDKSKAFFSYIHNETRHELAYHGVTHGVPGNTAQEFVQEWITYKNLDEAIETIKKGREIFKDTVGEYPKGGKYCGYQSNDFSDQSIARTGFDWWCRYVDFLKTETALDMRYGPALERSTAFNVRYFYESILDIPTTLNGALLSGIIHPKTVKQRIKTVLKNRCIKKALDRVDHLLEEAYIISVQEHISPSRDDGKRQQPNIYDDQSSLRCIFNHLKNKNVWYCTAGELCEWVKKKI